MSEPNLIDGHKFIDGRLVSAKLQRLVDAIREYSPELDVQWIPPELRSEGQAAFRIVHHPPGHPSYVIKHVQTEEEFDERILQAIIAGDQRNGEVTISEVEAYEKAQKLLKRQRYLDTLEELNDKAFHYARSNKNRYQLDKDTVFVEGRPGNQAPKKLILGPSGPRGKM